MSIKEIASDGTVTIYCTNCAGDQVVAPAVVELGRSLPGNKMEAADPEPDRILISDMIDMPPCPGCGAVTSYQQNFDVLDPSWRGSRFDLQRRAVNAYAEKLKSLGRIHTHCADVINARGAPTDIMAILNAKNLPVAVKRKNREA